MNAFVIGFVALTTFRSSSDYIIKVLQKSKKLQAELKSYEDVVKDRWKNKVRLRSSELTQDCIQNLSARRKMMELFVQIDLQAYLSRTPITSSYRIFEKRLKTTTSVAERILPRDLEQILDSAHFQTKSGLCNGRTYTNLLVSVVPAAPRYPRMVHHHKTCTRQAS